MYFKNNILISVEQDLQINRNMHRASHWYLNLDRIDCLARLLFYLNKYREKLNKVIVYLNRKTQDVGFCLHKHYFVPSVGVLITMCSINR